MFQEPRALLSRKPDKTQGILAGRRKCYVVHFTSCFWLEFTGFLFRDDVGCQCVTE